MDGGKERVTVVIVGMALIQVRVAFLECIHCP